ncbi:carboxyl-terminal-processing peptidase 3, chloroplastic [Selaginella moellendorffii]|uniref:carboxyl-terminal-processing peptidase 3, chloroplastic n=1 Tax=Selaginella moellendorffii TaxID=88036 RepID=UPI000D1C598B|nr:carboxyl-terminal-processing peptidase 3, chloroplastic [Selaginella moellendorffii]|eukprot:XP_024540786.1 carboxyl-terminal-processing peptidase 3, chloroplastic [Selaginella moellendorffii]
MDALCRRSAFASANELCIRKQVANVKTLRVQAKTLYTCRMRSPMEQSSRQKNESVKLDMKGVLSFFKKSLAVAAASLVLTQSPCPVLADEVLTFPGSSFNEVLTVQRTLLQAWSIIRDTYVDPTFNKQDWTSQLKDTILKLSTLDSSETAYEQVRDMLATLGDPYTRIVTPKEYENFRISNDGAVDGVGLLIATEQESGKLVVLATIEGGPAERAGVRPGDELVQIDDVALVGMNGEDAAIKLRGKAGTIVGVKLRRTLSPDTSSAPELKELKLKRETISMSPVYTAVLPHTNSSGRKTSTGYIRLAQFSQNAAADMQKAIFKLEESNVDSYILDLRNNPGGLVRAGLDVAEMWLDGNETLVNTVDRRGVTLPINVARGHALTHDPLVVLVNEGSASASEILAGALHDNGRAILVGHKTFGKGKIQSVSQLWDGSALFVTVAKYLSPSLHQIDQVGIAPDVECSPLISPDDMSEAAGPEKFLERDACVLVAEHLIE